MKIKESLSPLIQTPSHIPSNVSKNMVGKVFGVTMNENTPTKELFNKVGGWNGLGSIFYMDYDQSSDITEVDLNKCRVAKPLFPNQKYYPIVGELVLIFDLPNAGTQLVNSMSEKYYVIPINLWNNVHHNAQPASSIFSLGKTFDEKQNVNTLQPFEGDYIIEGRFGQSIRFSSTVKDPNVDNFWSDSGDNGNPIIILSNGHNVDAKSTTPYIEDVNKDNSLIIFASTQTIPLTTVKINLNVLTNPIAVDKYNAPQTIITSDRVVINAKKDDVLVFGSKNIEFYTKNIINLNSEDRTHINSPKIFLGTKSNGKLPDEPLLLGDLTVNWLDTLCKALSEFCSILSTASSTPAGTALLEVNTAAQLLSSTIDQLVNQTDNLKSKQNYTI